MKAILSLLLTAVLFLSSACAESATGALQEMYAQGELLMVQGDYAGAAAKFDALGTYSDASQMAMYCKAIAAAENFGLYSMAVDAFNDLGDFKDSKQMAKYYEGRAHEAAGTIVVATASDSALDKALWQLEEAEKVYGGLAFFKDSLTRYGACGERIKEIKGEQSRRAQIEREREQARMEGVYQEALTLEQNGDYAGAIKLYRSINGYKDCAERIAICETAILDGKYDAAVALMEAGKYSEAIEAFKAIKNHKDSAAKIKACETAIQTAILDGKYDAAMALMEAGKYSEAIAAFEAIRDYKDSAEQIKACETAILDGKYDAAVSLMKAGKYSEAIEAFKAIKDYKDSAAKIKECETAILDGKYDAAVSLMKAGKYSEAYEAFVALNGHKDSIAKANGILKENPKVQYQVAYVGSYITFGTYEQDGNTSNGKEDIEWLVLAKENNMLLVISRYALDAKPYNGTFTKATWETCTLRKWLNNDFLKAAFSSAEQEMIPTVMVSADKNPDYSTKPGNMTRDKVFLLSITEANKYFTSNGARQCTATAYAKTRGANTTASCWWWLRSPGHDQQYAAYVNQKGAVYAIGGSVHFDNGGVRPALWIDLAP